ncbi:MAG TPA: antibiotic biosynthesis monooxygenase [Solirubrobacteraceae bacterium]|jgi:quinol monooxygenase YgiN/mannose-6-phosphate isomerase-like protein (cupin superfamily)
MSEVGRYAKATAKSGAGEALAGVLLRVAEMLRDAPGCELYIVNRSPTEPDTVWVTELWRSQEDMDAALKLESAQALMPEVMALVAGFERIDVEPLGGVGRAPVGETGFTIINLESVEDMAPKYGLSEMGESRFAREDLGALDTGVSHQRLRPGRRSSFGHRHQRAEEVYVVLGGSGRVRIDDEIRGIRTLDAIRVAPGSIRAFEAGPEGLELLVVGPHYKGDGEMLPEFWPARD